MAGVEEDYFIPEEVRQTAFEWRVLIDSGNPSPEDLAQFRSWHEASPLHADAYDRATSVFEALGTLTEQELDPDNRPLPADQAVAAPRANRFLWPLGTPVRLGAIAACLAIVAVSAFIAFQALRPEVPAAIAAPPITASHETGVGETRTVSLPDGSELTLGASSVLSVSMSNTKRELTLHRGAALFDVAPDANRPFSVAAGDLTATALGTVFAVRNNGGVMRLAVSEGRVEAGYPFILDGVPSNLISRREIQAGQQIIATKARGLSSIKALRQTNFGAWREDRLTYVGATLDELVADANRYSERKITVSQDVQALDDLTVTVTFEGKDIDTMLATFPDMFPVDVDTSSPDQIVIRRR